MNKTTNIMERDLIPRVKQVKISKINKKNNVCTILRLIKLK